MAANRIIAPTLCSLAVAAAAVTPATAGDWFVSAGAGIDQIQGSSDTTTGGAVWAGDGTAHNVKFGGAYSFDATIGRRIADNWSLGLTYRRLEADIDFDASFTCCGMTWYFGEVTSDLVLLNAIYSASLSSDGRWGFETSVGAGVALNRLDLFEDFGPDGIADMTIESADTTEFALRASMGLRYALNESWAVHADVSLFDLGSYKTGDSRSAPAEPIGPYEIDAWGYGIGLGTSVRF